MSRADIANAKLNQANYYRGIFRDLVAEGEFSATEALGRFNAALNKYTKELEAAQTAITRDVNAADIGIRQAQTQLDLFRTSIPGAASIDIPLGLGNLPLHQVDPATFVGGPTAAEIAANPVPLLPPDLEVPAQVTVPGFEEAKKIGEETLAGIAL